MLEEPLHPGVIKPGEEVADISVEYPVHLPLGDPDRERIQRIMRATPGPEPIGETGKVLLVHRVQHLHHRTLEDLVLQRGDGRFILPSCNHVSGCFWIGAELCWSGPRPRSW